MRSRSPITPPRKILGQRDAGYVYVPNLWWIKISMLKNILILFFALLICCSAFAETISGEPDPNARFRGIPTFELDGSIYRLNRRLTTILLMGIDKTSDSDTSAGLYRTGGQADFLALLVIDDSKKSISMIQINRDTMVHLDVLNVLGEVTGKRTGQICLSYALGPGGEKSCEMTADAVSALLNNTPVNYYVSMSMDGIAGLNDALGGVTVTLEDDFSAFDPSMTAGATLTLHGMQAEYYVRGRYGVGEQSNVSRLARQRNYMYAALETLKAQLGENPDFLKALHTQLEPFLTGSLSRGALYNMGEKASRYEFSPIYELSGESRTGEGGFMEFYVHEEALRRLLADVLFEKVG